ncbi:hypothetical protein ACFQ0O_32615 [Saccharopolyspora spinosporotrichia]
MGHLLMVESWVGAMSALLPRGIRESGHRFSFITRDLHHYLRSSPVPGRTRCWGRRTCSPPRPTTSRRWPSTSRGCSPCSGSTGC